MNVILMATHLNRVTLQLFADSSYIIVKIVINFIVNQVFSMLCTKYDMGVDFR